MQGLKAALAILRDEYHEGDPLGSGRLLAIENRVFYLRGDAALVDVLKHQGVIQNMVLVDLQDVERETEAKVEALAA